MVSVDLPETRPSPARLLRGNQELLHESLDELVMPYVRHGEVGRAVRYCATADSAKFEAPTALGSQGWKRKRSRT